MQIIPFPVIYRKTSGFNIDLLVRGELPEPTCGVILKPSLIGCLRKFKLKCKTGN